MCSTSSLGNTNFEANGECTKGKGTNKQGNHSTLGPTCETMHDPVTNMGPKSMLILKANKDQLAYANAYTNHYRAPMSGPTKTHNVKVSDSHITWGDTRSRMHRGVITPFGRHQELALGLWFGVYKGS